MSTVLGTFENTAGRTFEFAGDVLNEFVNTVLVATGGLAEGASMVANTTGDIVNKVVHDVVGVKTTQVFQNVGDIAHDLSQKLGDVVTEIPLVGRPAAYLVERAGDGVYHVIVSVGDIAESTSAKLGQFAQKSADLVVFTIASTQAELAHVGESVKKVVSSVTRFSDVQELGETVVAAADESEMLPVVKRKRRSHRRRRSSGGSTRSTGRGRRRDRSQRRRNRGGRASLPIEYFGGNSGRYSVENGGDVSRLGRGMARNGLDVSAGLTSTKCA